MKISENEMPKVALDDFERQYLEEYKRDIEEEADSINEEFNELDSNIAIPKSSLLQKLTLYPTGDFPVTEYSRFSDDEWQFFGDEENSDIRTYRFKDKNQNLKFLKKVILYHYIPDFHPYGTVRSYITTLSYTSSLMHLDRFVFEPNFITLIPEDLKSISIRLLNDSLDEAKYSEYFSSYRSLYAIISFWAMLSNNGLIPDEYRLKVNSSKVVNKDRQKDVIRETLKSSSPYSPFSKFELKTLVNYAVFWTESAIPVIESSIQFIRDRGIDKLAKRTLCVRHRDNELEARLSTKIDGIEIVGLNRNCTIDKRDNKKSYRYTTVDKLAFAADKVRNGVFIFTALITGLRRRELSGVKFSDFQKNANGDCFLDISRFKTSDDPNYHGENDTLPIPEYLYDTVKRLEAIRNYINDHDKHYIFLPAKGRRKRLKINSSSINLLIKEISEATKLDGLHTHRFRKTIAEILIGQDETNIDIVRELLGHKSFAMTLRYIARNPYLVRAISRIMEHHHIKEFTQIIDSVSSGHFSGHAFERIAAQIKKRPAAFKGATLKLTIRDYVTAMLEAGEPVFIHRTPMDTFCLSVPSMGGGLTTPCVKDAQTTAGKLIPDPSNCQYQECAKAGISVAARSAIEENIIFYTGILEQSDVVLPRSSQREIERKIRLEKQHLENLNKYRNPLDDDTSHEEVAS